MNYGDSKQLNKYLLYKRIVEWNKDKLVLNDGTVLTLEMSENDCCAYAGGTFSNVELDAVITDVEVGEKHNVPDEDTIVNEVKVTLFHNQNPIALAEMTANAGNGGYYYSIGSFVVNGIHFPIVDA
ncbi:DUF7448 domain-containing protein [Halobacillus aidingensis]|uniref:DUF7448 domain-containing protein n=1 Tax=Halobacillus aidingensis TaxID=240303 RepID=A0A1H0MH17_HALAD|nr:hypothetical protein [Halobacillus aidingensis]SDO79712.1 hypothetical protein SAMN05421677_10836 [Halobacillus aidingensis]